MSAFNVNDIKNIAKVMQKKTEEPFKIHVNNGNWTVVFKTFFWNVQDFSKLQQYRDQLKDININVDNFGVVVYESPEPRTEKTLTTIEKIKKQITDMYPQKERTVPQDDKVSTIVKGYVQSGKTKYELCQLWLCMFDVKQTSVLVLSNSLASFNQVIDRDIPDFNMWIDEIAGASVPEFHLIPMVINSHVPTVPLKENQFIITLSNPRQLERVQQFLGNIQRPYSVIVDEADTCVKDIKEVQDMTKTGVIYDDIINGANNAYQVTATPFANLNKIGTNAITYQLSRPANYRGVENVVYHKTECLRNKSKAAKLAEVVSECMNTCKQCPGGYKAVLVNAAQHNAVQEAQARSIKRKNPLYQVYIINTDMSGDIKEMKNGKAQVTKFEYIHQLFKSFEETAKTDKTKKYVIVSGQMASRANSYRPLRQDGNGGLSGLIYIPPKTGHCASFIQGMRVFGVYSADYPEIHLYTTEETYKRIQLETLNIDAWIKETSKTICNTREVLETIPTYNTNKHDRKQVDDTKMVQKSTLQIKDFDSWESAFDEIKTLYPGTYKNHQGLTTWNTMNIPNMKYSEEGKCPKAQQNAIRASMKQVLSSVEDRIQVAWSNKRYNDLHNAYKHFAPDSNYFCEYIVGDCESTTDIPYVKWDNSITTTSDDTMYWFYTTKKTVRIYLPNETAKITTGLLSHV